MAFIDRIQEFYTAKVFQNMDAPFKRGYSDAASKGLLNTVQTNWATAVPPIWDPADITELNTALTSAFTEMNNNHAPVDANVRDFKSKLSTVPPPTIEKILEELQKNSEKLDIVLQYMGINHPDIADAIYRGLIAVDYKNGKNRIAPIYPDKKNVFMRAADKVNKGAEDYLGKYISKGAREKMPNVARAIFDEISKAKIKPEDGLKKVLESADAIKANLPAVATDMLDTMLKALKPLSKTDQFAKALKSGRAMRHLVEDLAEFGAENNKVEEMKHLQFLLNGLSYELTGSSIRGELKKNPLTIFSDKGMSWNNNEGMRFMANATDKLLNLGFMATFNLANMVKNKIRGSRSKFSPKTWRNVKSVKDIESAQEYIAANPAIPLANLEITATAARTAANNALLTGDENATDLEKIAKEAELRVMAKEHSDSRIAGTNDSKLHKKLQLMAHWDMLRSGKLSDLSFQAGKFQTGRHKILEKGFFNDTTGGTTKYQDIWNSQISNWNGGMAA